MEDNSEQLGQQKELKMKLAQIEADIEKACEEEDYDRAGMYNIVYGHIIMYYYNVFYGESFLFVQLNSMRK